MSVNTKMTALADEIRELSGTTTTKSIDAMTTDVNAANSEISEQTDLILQITTALEGKSSGGSGGNIETCTATVCLSGDSPMLPVTMFYVDENGQPTSFTETTNGINDEFIVKKNSLLAFNIEADSYTTASGGITILNSSPMLICGITGAGSIEN